jgi:DegT/DnrJ/EryC1/StrS aminotransferase family
MDINEAFRRIELSLRALDLPAGSPVLTPTLTFCGAVEAIVHAGLRPVLADTDEATLTVNAQAVADAAGEKPAAMVVQHMAGHPVPAHQLQEYVNCYCQRAVGRSTFDPFRGSAHAGGRPERAKGESGSGRPLHIRTHDIVAGVT